MIKCPAGCYLYEIKPGDTLWNLSQRFNITLDEIEFNNPLIDKDNLYIGQTICIPERITHSQMPTEYSQDCIGRMENSLSNQLRMLWEQHVFWTRMVIMSIVFGLPDEEASTNRLLRNPKDFSDVLRSFYGDETADEFLKLFTEHLTIASELVKAAKAGDSNAVDDAEKRWYDNADEIAYFLADINPYWSAQDWQKMLYDHLAMIKTETVNMLSEEFEDSVNIFDEIEQEAMAMADTMSQGLVAQFPQNFK